MPPRSESDGAPVPRHDYVTDEAYLLDQNMQILARILEVCREIRVILQSMADRHA
jgi:hypothetical protein